MTHDSLNPQERLEALLDGRLRAAEKANAQREFAAETQLQDAINSALKTRFAPPAPDRLLARVRAAHKSPAPPRKLKLPDARRLLLVAACILVLIGSGWWLVETGQIPGLNSRGRLSRVPRTTPPFDGPTTIDVHRTLVASGYKPAFETSDPRAIAASVWRRTGQGLAPSNLPKGARVLGMTETACLSPSSLVLMMEVNGQPLSVIIDKLANDRTLCVSAPDVITPFRQEVGSLVIYEVTPHGAPLIRDRFIDPKQSPDWYKDGGGF